MSTAIRTSPVLWEKVKKEVTRSSKGGSPGKWSARKAQRAVALYKARGGGYKGKKSPSNSLTRWSKQKWGYINETKSSKKKSKRYGRYLPLEVRKRLTASERRTENRRKGRHYGKRVPYSKSVSKKIRKVLNKK